MALTTSYNKRTQTGAIIHQATRTHREISMLVGLPLTAVAIVREVLADVSAQSHRALAECNRNRTKAAVWLAEHRQCYQIAELITPEVVNQIAEIDGRIL